MTLTVAKKLTLLTCSALLGIGLLTGINMNQMEKVYDAVNYANINVLPSMVLLDDMRREYLRSRLEVHQHILATDAAEKAVIEKVLADYRKKMVEDLKSYTTNGCMGISCIANDKERGYINEIGEAWEKYDALIEPILVESRKGVQGLEKARKLAKASNAFADPIGKLIVTEFDFNVELGKQDSEQGTSEKSLALKISLVIAFFTLAAIGGIGYVVYRSLMRQLGGEPEDVSDITDMIAIGDLSSNIQLQRGDSTSLLAKMKVLKDTMERLASKADAIGKGDLAAEIELLSEHDRLGKAINNMILMLRAADEEDAQRNWLKDGQNQLSTTLAGDLSTTQLANMAIGLIGRHLAAGRGVFYLYMHETEQLELIGSYMYTERNNIGARFALGEGAVGQVAREKQPIILTVASNEAAPIVTGTTHALPRYTYTYPLLNENTLLGVIELASFEQFDEKKIEFLVNATGILATLVNVAEQRAKVRELLVATEAAEKEARYQSEQLRESNAIMEEQQQQLQQQTEELQQSNAQMEEQQQQLQQQSEELQQSNSQMEEQQQQLEQQNRVLEESRHAIDEKANQLELSSKYKSEFLANMSHELRTPLNSIILLSKMMSNGEEKRDEAETLKWAQVINRSGEDLLRLINDVLDLSKVEAGRMDLQVESVHSDSLCSELQEMFEHVAKDKGLAFKVEDTLQGEFLTDRDKLSQILRNLLSNALKFTKQGSVTLTVSRRTGALPVCLSVRDSGIGIPEEKKALIFEAFQQADGSTSREFGGTGLGLTISLRFAQLLGGTIELKSVPGQGSEFFILLPETPPTHDQASVVHTVSQPSMKDSISDQPSFQATSGVQDDRGNLRKDDQVILLIDDDTVLGQTLLTINRRLGYKTLLAHTGAEGLELARQYRPKGILLDLGLPDMDGVKVLHEIKSRRESAAIPVYIVSARDRDDALLHQGAFGFLQKPADEKRLVAAEAALLGAVGAKAAGGHILVLENGGITAADVARITNSESGAVVAATPDTVKEILRQHAFRLVIIDLADTSVQPGLDIAAAIRANNQDIALVFFSRKAPSSEDESKLRQYSDSIIVKTQQADRRLLENVERFLREVPAERADLPVRKNSGEVEKKLAGKHVLLVDDDPRNLFVITAALERNGAKVSNAVNGKRGLEFLDQQRVDLIISDIMMPEMDGYQFITEIRGNPVLADIPVLAITAKALPADRDKIMAVGADDYLSKPVDYDVLLVKAAKWCEGRAA